MQAGIRTGAVMALLLLVAGCGTAPTSLADLNASYERALELADSGEATPMVEALEILDGMGASAAASGTTGGGAP